MCGLRAVPSPKENKVFPKVNSLYHVAFLMASTCPKCGRNVPDYSAYCPHCGFGISPHARTSRIYFTSLLMVIASVGSLILLVLSARALLYVETWYPLVAAQSWFVFNWMFLLLSLCEVVSGVVAAFFSYSRRSFRWATTSAVLCTLSGGGIWLVSLLAPSYQVWQSILYYFLPMFLPPLVGTILLFPRRQEFER